MEKNRVRISNMKSARTLRVAVPVLKNNEVGVMERILGSGGFCTVSAIRWIKINVNVPPSVSSNSASASSVSASVSVSDVDDRAHAHAHDHARALEDARSRLSKQFEGYEEKHHSSKNIVIPGYTKISDEQLLEQSQRPPRVALKKVKSSLQDDNERYRIGVQDLVAEASVLAQCSHPHIISLYAVGCDDDDDDDDDDDNYTNTASASANSNFMIPPKISFMVIDQLRSTLRNKLHKWREDKGATPIFLKSKKSLDDLWLERMIVIAKVAGAVQYLHSKGFLHRDITPDNIGFADDNVVKLFDFGLAKSVGRDRDVDGDGRGHCNDVTEDGCVEGDENEIFDLTSNTGTLRYMSPEIALAMPYGFKVDVYSLSLVMYEILTLIKPYSTPSVLREPKGFIQMVIKDGHRPALDDSLPNTIRTLLQRMWSSDAAKRPSSKEVVEYLEGLLRGDESELYPVGHFGWKNRFHEVRDSVINARERERERRKHNTTNLPTTSRALFIGKKFNEL